MLEVIVVVDTKNIKVELVDKILIATWKCSFVDIHIAKEVVSSRINVMQGERYPALVKITSVKDSTKEARDFLASQKGCEGVIAMAIYVESILEIMVANLFIYLNKPIIPTKVFKDELKARAWLFQYSELTQSKV
jgi:hypothetical protein